MFEFKEEYKTGVEFIDEQHEMLFDIARKCYTLYKDEFVLDKYDKIVHVIEELQEYTTYHFNYEEKFMAKINYPKMFTQKIQHETFIKELYDIDLSKLDHNQDESMLNLLGFLSDWLIKHICGLDTQIGEFVNRPENRHVRDL